MGIFSKRNDETVLIELTSHQMDLQGFVRSLMPGNASVDDVVQQTNLAVWRKRGDFKPGTNFRAWLFTIARLEVLAERKRSKRKSWLVIDDDLALKLAATMDDLGKESSGGFLRQALLHCLARLKPQDRSVIEQFYFQGHGIRQIAEEEGRSEGAVRVGLHRVRLLLRRCIEAFRADWREA